MSSTGDSRDVQSLSNFEIKDARHWSARRVGIIVVVSSAALIVLGFVLALALGLGLRKSPPLPEVFTPCGFASGEVQDGVYSFLGLPYAHPPLRELRFRRPRDIYSFESCRDAFKTPPSEAKRFRAACLQRHPIEAVVDGAEDCLYLNVFSPDIRPGTAKPVVVVVGGLFFLYGSGHAPGFRVTADLIKATDAVHVTFNSRLGTHGFVPVAESNADANAGLWDVVSVLRWVQENIRAFGGDPGNVMLLGYGSGATSSLALSLATSTVTFNLFHKVWLASPMLRVETSVDEARARYKRNHKCISRECLAKKKDLELASMLMMTPNMRRGWFALPQLKRTAQQPGILLVDNILIQESPATASKLRLRNIPFVIGSTTNEVDVYLSPAGVRLWDAFTYEDYINSSLSLSKDDFQAIKSLYPLSSGTLEEVFTRLVTDARVTCPLLCFSKDLRSKTRRLYQYVVRGIERYVDPYAFQFRINNSFHGWDALLYFSDGSLDRLASVEPKGEYLMRDRLRQAVRDFARSGSVKHFRYDVMNVIDVHDTKYVENYKSSECDLWRRIAKGKCFDHAWAT